MTTATRARPKAKSALAELERLEAAWGEAAERSREVSLKHRAAHDRAVALSDERRRLINREPGLVDHLGQPLEPDNAIAQIDRQIADLGDLNDLGARAQHVRRIETKAKTDWSEYVAAHFDELIEALEPQAEAAIAAVRDKAAELAEAADRYLGLAKRVDGLRGIDRTRHRLRVPAIDSASELVRVTAGYRDVSLPLPTELR